ncbi:hypothetical protein PRIEUP_LOCUS670, partial [Pristimantis euphronides]
MKLKGILLSLALLCLIPGGTSNPQCTFSIPALLKSGEESEMCLEIQNHKEPVKVDIVLEVTGVNYTGVNYTVINQEIPVEDTFNCYKFKVPAITRPAPVFLLISAAATNFDYTERRDVVVAPTGNIVILQIERSIFKPGQTAHFNLIVLDNNLQPVDDTVIMIYVHMALLFYCIQDPAENNLYQWKNLQTMNSILSLSFDILPDSQLGYYTILVDRETRGSVSKAFQVDDYTLPNYVVQLLAPNTITILDKFMEYTVTCTYTYGEPLAGIISGKICRPPLNYYPGNACNRNPDGLCSFVTGELDSNGTYTGKLDLTNFQLDRSGNAMGLTMQMTVTELGSEIQATESRYISITSQLGRVTFNHENMDQSFKPGLPYFAQATVVDGLGNPLSNQPIELQVNGVTVSNLTSDANGKVQDFIDTTALDQSTTGIQVIYKYSEQCYDSTYLVPSYSNDYFSITRSYSRSGSFVHIEGPKEELQCGQTYTLIVKYIFSQSGLQEGQTSVNWNYMAMSKTKIINYGTVPTDLSNSLKGEFSVSQEVTSDHAPVIAFIVYCRLTEEIVAHTIKLNTEKCFKNKISMDFSEKRGTPNSIVNVNITTSPHSMCAMRIYDASLGLLAPDQPVTAAMVYDSLMYTSLTGYSLAGFSVEPSMPPCIDPNIQLKVNGLYYVPTEFPNEVDAYQQLSSCGMLMITNVSLSQPRLCGGRFSFGGGRPLPVFGSTVELNSVAFAREPGMVFEEVSDNSGGAPTTISSTRNFFPAVWFFNVTSTGESGSESLPLKVPGTITRWEGDMLCWNSGDGFGITKNPANFTSFQEFFASCSLPYSIVRTETLIARVVVFNYLPKCMKVNAEIQPSENYTTERIDGNNGQCICAGQRAVFSFALKAKLIGVMPISITAETVHIGDTCDGSADQNEPRREDTIQQSIIVEPEGIYHEETQSLLLCPKESSLETEVKIPPLENAVEGTKSVKIGVMGNLLGRSLEYPESMIREPTGCGEQIHGTLAPLPLIYDFLNETGRLTEDMSAKLKLFMRIGYMRLLPVRNRNGGFSVFPNGEVNTLLTVLILDTMQAIKKHVDVDVDGIINQGLVFLERRLDKNTGAFKSQGTMFNNGLTSGSDDVPFTAIVVTILLRSIYAATATLLRPSMNYLEAASQTEQDVYTIALLFRVFRMVGNEERSTAMWAKLNERKIEMDGSIHWEHLNKPSQPRPYVFWRTASSTAIEITALVLSGLAMTKSPTPKEHSLMAQTCLWLVQQQNAYGSYSTTKDTAVAIGALTDYSKLVYQKDASNTVDVKCGDDVTMFNLKPGNRDSMQTKTLPNIPETCKITANGNGCVLVQTTMSFNVPVNEEDSAFRISVYSPPESCVNGVATTIPLYMNISYNGPRNETNMVLAQIAMPSGYTPEQKSLQELKSKVPKVEMKNNYVYIYLNSVPSGITVPLQLILKMGQRVQNMQQKYIYLWDYYEKAENSLAVIHHPCSL